MHRNHLQGTRKDKQRAANSITMPTITSRAGYLSVDDKIIDKKFEEDVQELVDGGMTEEEARQNVTPMEYDDVPREDRFVGARVRENGEYTSDKAQEVAENVVNKCLF